MTQSKIQPIIESICKFSQRYNSKTGAIRSSEPSGVNLIKKMNHLGNDLLTILDNEFTQNFGVQVSKGQSNIPKILWVSLLPIGRSVSKSCSITMCFGRNGEGLVVGVMDSVLNPQGLAPRVKRTESDILVDVDGLRQTAKYNNKFFNPKEFLVDTLDERELVKHIEESSILLYKLLKKNSH